MFSIRLYPALSIAIALTFHLGCISEKKTSSSKTPVDSTIATVGKEIITTPEFKYVYNKTNSKNPDAYTKESLQDYMDLYLKFKLKVHAAKALGMDTTDGFKREFEGFRKQLAAPYLVEKQVTDMMIRQAYDRMKEEIRASHILILCKPDADPKDTLIAYGKIKALRDKIVKGESFDLLAAQSSEDPSAKSNKGDLGYFTSLRMVYEFENAAYTTAVGQVSGIFRTKFGYHILKVVDRRPSQGQVHAAHIMVRYNQGMNPEDSIIAKGKIDEIYQKVKSGEDWAMLCLEFSEDPNTRAKSGELNWFSTGKLNSPSFEEATFKLKNIGDVSAPVQTAYGWHIIKLLDRKPLAPFEEVEASLRAKVTKDSRSEMNKRMLIDRLKKENNFTENTKAYAYAISKADSTVLLANWTFTPSEKNAVTLFSIKNQNYTIENFFQYVRDKQQPQTSISPSSYFSNLYKQYVDESIIAFEEAHLADKYLDYRMLYKEYYEGILLFQIMEDNVWQKAIQDTAGLRKHYGQTSSKYQWNERAHAYIFSAADKTTLESIKKEAGLSYYPVTDYSFEKMSFEKNKATLSAASKSQITKLIVLMARDTAYSAHITISRENGEALAVYQARRDSLIKFIEFNSGKLSKIKILDGGAQVKRKTEAQRLADRYAQIELFTSSKKSLEAKYNKTSTLTLQVQEGLYQQKDNDLVSQVPFAPGAYEFERNGRFFYILIDRMEAPRAKYFDECKGLVISDYQNYLEAEWVKELKATYPITVNESQLNTLIKQ
ncbi:MAG: peptidylprolyl isomerase [Cytophagaceae bacterium]|jgi:peptidyl-prolyl cis-trans isomerase SurA|nr:peptidylprolyl isomerase [Cytophagaceae bacterium]